MGPVWSLGPLLPVFRMADHLQPLEFELEDQLLSRSIWKASGLQFGATLSWWRGRIATFVQFCATLGYTSTPQLPCKTPQIPSNIVHKALIEVHWVV